MDFQSLLTPPDPGFYKDLLDHMSDGVYFVDREKRILYWNEGAHRLTGYTSEELVGKSCHEDILCHIDYAGHKLGTDSCPLSATIQDGGRHEASVFLRHKQGRRVPVSVRVQPLRGADGSIVGAIEIFSDDSAHSEARRRTDAMNRLAFLDHLTQLPNRRFAEMSVQTAISEFNLHKSAFGVLMVDVDGFKAINDSFGHSSGDRALLQVAQTLAGSLRPTDTVGRWGGDEFLAVVREVNKDVLKKLAERCVSLAQQTLIPSNDERLIRLSISVGAAMPRTGETAEELLQRADTLMYQSKACGRGCASEE